MQESYGVLREHVESVIKDVLGLSGVTFKVGLYFHCKTAYLLGILRNVDVAILAQSSQQECIDNAHDYACNTVTIKVHKTILHKDLNVVNFGQVLQHLHFSIYLLDRQSCNENIDQP